MSADRLADEPGWAGAFRRDGYAIVRSAAGAEDVAALRAAFPVAGGQVGAIERAGAVYAVRHALRLPVVQHWATSGLALGLARSALGEGARPVRGVLFDKRPEANWPVAWHQDVTVAVRERREVEGYGPWSVKGGVPHVRPPAEVLERMATVRLHLDGCPASNGALRVIPGSHRAGALDRQDLRRAVEGAASVVCEARAGDAVVMRPLLLHSSAPSERPRHRRVVHIEYAVGEPGAGLAWAEATG